MWCNKHSANQSKQLLGVLRPVIILALANTNLRLHIWSAIKWLQMWTTFHQSSVCYVVIFLQGNPQRGGFRVFLFWNGGFWILSPGEVKFVTVGTQHPASSAQTPLRSGLATWCLHFPASSSLNCQPIICSGDPSWGYMHFRADSPSVYGALQHWLQSA